MAGGFRNKGPGGGGAGALTAGEILWVQTGNAGVILLPETTAPSASAGVGKLYVKSSDSLPYFKDDSGNEYSLIGAGVGDVNGPVSSTDNAVIRFNGTGGKVIQESPLMIDDSGNISPITTDTGALGTSLLMWSDAFLASGAVINFNNGDITITHAADSLTFAGGTYAFNGAILPAVSDGSALGSATQQFSDLFLAEGGVINWDNSDIQLTQVGNQLRLAGSTNFMPDTNDGGALGVSGGAWSDLFLASGAVINFAAANVVVTHSSGILTVGTGDLRVTTAGSNTASVVTVGGTQTLTNKTLTNPAISTISNTGTLTLPTSTDTLVGRATTDTLTNKTLTASSNVLGGVTMTLGSDATGDIYYRNSGGQLTRLAVGTNGHVLTLAAGLPSWAAASGGGVGITWNEISTTSTTASINNGYITNNASLVTVALPATAAVGSIIRVVGKGAGGWRVTQAASQLIRFGDLVTTTGTGGRIDSVNQYDALEIVCTVANTTWTVLSSQGNMTVT